jgi:acetylornithine deacetylase/succinyl-diaminopimelate desuccinylase-like protein
VLKMMRNGTSMNLDGIWGGNMFAGGSGAILPNKVTSKHNFRYRPNMTGPEIVDKLRAYLDKLGYKDVEINVVGDVPWAIRDNDNDLARSNAYTQQIFGVGSGIPFAGGGGGYWPAYVFSGKETNIDLPINSARGGTGGNAHAANEWYVIEGSGNQLGMASAEKLVATALYNYAGRNGPIEQKPAKPAGAAGNPGS